MIKQAAEHEGVRYAFVAIGNYIKYAHAVAIETKRPHDVTHSFEEIFDQMGVSSQLYSDRDGSFESTLFIRLLSQRESKQYFG
jgi:hypothetical protein